MRRGPAPEAGYALADIFISYSQSAPEATEKLAEDLAKAGYTVWFDTRLLPMDVFWKVIRDEIKAAKAVIVIWSARAIDSEWVYAEAKLAHEMKKLICVRTAEVPAYDVPMPFNGYNVTEVGERQKIHDALEKIGLKAGQSAPLAKAEMEVTEVTVAWGEAKASGNPKLDRGVHPALSRPASVFRGAGGGVARGAIGGARRLSMVAKPAEVPLPQAGDVFLRIEPGMHTAIDQPHRRGCGWHADGDGLGRQDGAALGAAGRRARRGEAAAHAARAHRRGR